MIDSLEGTPLEDVLGDGAYDTLDCREAVHERRLRTPNCRKENRCRHYEKGIRQFEEYKSLAVRVGLYGNKRLGIIVDLELRRSCSVITCYSYNRFFCSLFLHELHTPCFQFTPLLASHKQRCRCLYEQTSCSS